MDAIPALASFSREKLIDNLIVRGRKARILSVWMLMQKDTWFLLSTTAQQLLFIVILLLEEKCIMWASLGFGINLLVTEMKLLEVQVQELCYQIHTISLCDTERMIPT